jgi:AcrR family transcriptional regulator
LLSVGAASETEHIGLRERRRRDTASELEDVALRLFTERGFDHVTVDDIADAAGISRRTFFRYFASKEDLVVDNQEARLERLRELFASRPADEGVLGSLRWTLKEMARDYEDERDRLLARVHVLTQDPSLVASSVGRQALWEQAIAEAAGERLGLASDDPAIDVRPALIAATGVAAMRVSVAAWLAKGGEGPLSDVVDEVLDLVEGGLEQACD